MRAIAIQQPAASRIAAGTKKTEHRTRRIAPGPLLICADGAALCVVDVVKVTERTDGFAWHLGKPRRVRPFPVRSYGWIVHVPDRSVHLVVRRAPPMPYRFSVGDRMIRGEGARTPAGARARAAELAAARGVPIWIYRDGIQTTLMHP